MIKSKIVVVIRSRATCDHAVDQCPLSIKVHYYSQITNQPETWKK